MAELDLTDPAFYDWFGDERVRLSDTDLVGHVNNVSHTAMVESGRVDYLLSLLADVNEPFGSIMFVRLELDFHDDLFWPGRVRCGARVIAIGRSSFRVAVSVFDGDRCVTSSENVMVWLGNDKKSAPLPDAVRARLEAELPAT